MVQQPAEQAGGLGIAVTIWTPAILFAGGLAFAGQAAIGVVALGLAFILHSVLRPYIAIYVMIMSIPLEWMAVLVYDVLSLPKLVALFAVLFSLPKILSSLSPATWDPLVKWILGLIIWSLISLSWSPYPLHGFIGWQSLVLLWGIPVLMCLHINTQKKLRAAMLLFVLSCLICNLGYMKSKDVQQASDTDDRQQVESFMGGEEGVKSGNPNIISRIMAIAVVTTLFLILTARSNSMRLALAACTIFLALGIVVLKGRSVWLATPFALGCSVVFLGGGGASKRLILVIILAVLSGGAFYVASSFGFLGEGVRTRFESIFEEGTSAGSRGALWTAHVNEFINTGTLGSGYRQMALKPSTNFKVAHNDIMSIAGELGSVGLILFAGFHIALYRRIRNMKEVWPKMYCLAVLILILFNGLTSTDFRSKNYPMAVGLIVATIQLDEKSRREEDPHGVLAGGGAWRPQFQSTWHRCSQHLCVDGKERGASICPTTWLHVALARWFSSGPERVEYEGAVRSRVLTGGSGERLGRPEGPGWIKDK